MTNTKKSDLTEGEFYGWDTWKKRDRDFDSFGDFRKVKLISKTARSNLRGWGAVAPTMVLIEHDKLQEVRNPDYEWATSPDDERYLKNEDGTVKMEYVKVQSAVHVWELFNGTFEEAQAYKKDLREKEEARKIANAIKAEERMAEREATRPIALEALAKLDVKSYQLSDPNYSFDASGRWSLKLSTEQLVKLAQAINFSEAVLSEFEVTK